jgi:transposase
MPINVKTQESLAGLLFITYLSLLLRMHIVRQIQSVGLQKKHSLEHIFVELEKIRWIELPDDKCILTEVGKKQREILDALNIAPDVTAFV